MTILPRPPKEWKRPSIPVKVKMQVLINQQGKCAETGEKLGSISNVEFDHRPALYERKFDTEAWDTVPPANDLAYLEAVLKPEHQKRTSRDAGRRAKEKRVSGKKKSRFSPLPSGCEVDKPKKTEGEGRKPKRKIQSPGFRKDVTRTFKGEVRPRT